VRPSGKGRLSAAARLWTRGFELALQRCAGLAGGDRRGPNLFLAKWRARRAIKRIVRRYSPYAQVFSIGATRIDPRHLAVWITTETDDERDRLRAMPAMIDAFRQALRDAGYPPAALPEVGFEFESEETVRRDYEGNWFYRTK
jgi:hypothetical protein